MSDLTYKEYQKKVSDILKRYPVLKLGSKHIKMCRKFYKLGYNVEFSARLIFLNK